ncbi:MAG: CHAT domain-containing protein [Chitinophagales bacterium]
MLSSKIKNMPMTPNKTLQLNLINPQTQNLLQLQQQLNEKLEQWGSLRPEMLADLTEEMKKILQGQTEYPDIAAQARNRQSRLHLTHDDPNILNLPWRLATQELSLLFLTKGKNTQGDLPILEADNPPLKILVMISSPENASYESRLNYEEEEDQIIRAFENLFDIGGIEIDFTDDGSLDNLAEKIAANRYHIVHFSGHGVYHKEKQKSYLALEDSLTMHQELVEAEKFAEVFQRKPQNMPALIVLSSCQTAKGGTEQGMKSVTDELLLKGLPAVISMSVSVTDYFATYFAGVLYQQLAQKEPLFRAFQSAIGATQQHELQRLPNRPPSQWMIPQLFVSQQVEQPVDFSKATQNLHYSAWKFVSGKEGLQSQKRSNYQFVGRRRDRKRIFQSWAKRPAILLKGQGGVGKTAMAEYVLQRLVAKNPHFHAFIFNEYSANMSNVIVELEKFLKSHKLRKLVLALRKEHKDNAYEHFEALFAEVEERCQPLFIFDNLESFQSTPGAAFRTELADSLTKIIDFCYTEDIPLILTCRYSVAECSDIPFVNLNQVEPNDFLKKALQMSLQALPRKIQQQGLAHLLNEQKLTFREVITWLHETFGGNYRALEFFDEVFAKKKNKLPQALKTLADFKQQYADAEIETRQRMSKNLLFEELLKLLEENEKTTLRLLSRFRIPVLVTALQMQEHDLDYASILDLLQELTLLEQYRDVEQLVLQYYYVTPLVKDLVKGAFEKEEGIGFSVEMAGRYHYWMDKEVNHKTYSDLEEAFDFFVEAKDRNKVNELGRILCFENKKLSQYFKSYKIGKQVYKLNGEISDWYVLNMLGMNSAHLGIVDEASSYYSLCEKLAIETENEEQLSKVYSNSANLHRRLGEYNIAIELQKKSWKLSRKSNNPFLEIATDNS